MVYPEVQAKGQAMIDRVVGRDRLPTLVDRKDLPYIDCVVSECLRWNPGRPRPHGGFSGSLHACTLLATPIGIAHSITEDDEYRGYRIPKGATVLPNVW